jgi:hypothetical protein
MSQSRNWNFTLNNFNEDDLENFDRLASVIGSNASDILYMVIGKEIGQQNQTPHLQGFIQFRKKRRMSQVKAIFGSAGGRLGHLSTMRRNSSPVFCAQYCKKDGDFQEWGTLARNQGAYNENFYRIILAQ